MLERGYLVFDGVEMSYKEDREHLADASVASKVADMRVNAKLDFGIYVFIILPFIVMPITWVLWFYSPLICVLAYLAFGILMLYFDSISFYPFGRPPSCPKCGARLSMPSRNSRGTLFRSECYSCGVGFSEKVKRQADSPGQGGYTVVEGGEDKALNEARSIRTVNTADKVDLPAAPDLSHNLQSQQALQGDSETSEYSPARVAFRVEAIPPVKWHGDLGLDRPSKPWLSKLLILGSTLLIPAGLIYWTFSPPSNSPIHSPVATNDAVPFARVREPDDIDPFAKMLPMSIDPPPRNLANDAEVIVASVDDPAINDAPVEPGRPHVTIFIDRPGTKVLLVLNSNGKTNWQVLQSPDTDIVGMVVANTGLIAAHATIPTITTTAKTVGYLADLPYADEVYSPNFRALLVRLNKLFGITKIDAFRRVYSIPSRIDISNVDAASRDLALTDDEKSPKR